MAHTHTHTHTFQTPLKEIYAVFTVGKQNNKTNSRYPLSVNTQPLTQYLPSGLEWVGINFRRHCECH